MVPGKKHKKEPGKRHKLEDLKNQTNSVRHVSEQGSGHCKMGGAFLFRWVVC